MKLRSLHTSTATQHFCPLRGQTALRWKNAEHFLETTRCLLPLRTRAPFWIAHRPTALSSRILFICPRVTERFSLTGIRLPLVFQDVGCAEDRRQTSISECR